MGDGDDGGGGGYGVGGKSWQWLPSSSIYELNSLINNL